MEFLIISLIIFAFSLCLSLAAGLNKNIRLFLFSTLVFVLASSIMYLGARENEPDYDDDCTKAGGRYVLDEKIQQNGETALDVYKCVR